MLSSRFSASPYVIELPSDNVIVAGIVTKSSGYTEGDAGVLELLFVEGAIAGDIAAIGGRENTRRGGRDGGSAVVVS